MDGTPFDPAATLAPEDPLRDWAATQEIDPVTGQLLLSDPQAAIDRMVAKGVPPPPHVGAGPLGFADSGGNNVDPTSGMLTTDRGAPFRLDPQATQKWRQNTETAGAPGAVDPAPAAVPLPVPRPVETPFASSSPLDPAEESPVPLPKARPAEAGPGASDISAQSKKKKGDLGDALGDFSKSFAGLKPIQPPPLNPVGTPSVRAASASGAPNIANLLQLIGQQSGGASPVQTLGRLLVAGKA